ncbi:hypothetical protein A54_122 [Septuagintavirus sv54]|uniref:Uncharacterized protein n=1 Tax=Escherichia phage A5-4 TaxID=2996162 RepID=A0AAE9TIR4_9CAUD|nr:hypothetical protein A54_122 [Escherichia phage A5-4]
MKFENNEEKQKDVQTAPKGKSRSFLDFVRENRYNSKVDNETREPLYGVLCGIQKQREN